MKRWFSSWWPLMIIAVLITVFVLAGVESAKTTRNQQVTQDRCVKSCAPYRMIACVKDLGVYKAVCEMPDPFEATIVVLEEPPNKTERCRDCFE
jgi:hypothetical protein